MIGIAKCPCSIVAKYAALSRKIEPKEVTGILMKEECLASQRSHFLENGSNPSSNLGRGVEYIRRAIYKFRFLVNNMNKLIKWGVVLLLIFILFTYFKSDKSTTGNVIQEEIKENGYVEIINFAFIPNNIDLSVGGSVKWENKDDAVHTIVFEDIESGELVKGDSWERVFSKGGVYQYYCKNHPYMTGRISVHE